MARDDLRPDIQAAKDRARGTFIMKGDLRKLESNLWENETVDYLASGSYSGGQGILALTDRRLFFFVNKITKQINEDFALDKISSIQWSSGMVTGTITVFVSNNKAEITGVPKDAGKAFVDAVRSRISKGSTAPQAAAAALAPVGSSPEDVFAQLEKLGKLRDAGVVTPDEFEAKKAELLARI